MQAVLEATGAKCGRITDPKSAASRVPRRRAVPNFVKVPLKVQRLRCSRLSHALSCRFSLRNNLHASQGAGSERQWPVLTRPRGMNQLAPTSQQSNASSITTEESTCDGLWTIDDVARYARCSVRHITTLREHHGLPYRKLGHLVRFSPEAVKRWFED